MLRICPSCDIKTDAEHCPDCGRLTVVASRMMPKVKADPFVGKTIEGKYEVLGRIGRGGMGSVYKCRHTETDGQIAVKLIRADKLEDENHIRRFYIEAQNTHQLHHPNTVRVSDFGQTEEGVLYMVMEYIQGKPLKQVIKEEGRLSPARVVRIAEQVLKSLGEAHAHQVVHRDIKPDNIMLMDQFGEPDFVKVLDFGVSRSLQGSGASTRGAIGTPKYMSPEQWSGKPADGRADLYALGGVMYHMLAGRLPFTSAATGTEQLMAYMNAHLKERPLPLQQIMGGMVPAELAEFVMWLLEKEPDDRPADSMAALQRLKAIRESCSLAEDTAPIPSETIEAFVAAGGAHAGGKAAAGVGGQTDENLGTRADGMDVGIPSSRGRGGRLWMAVAAIAAVGAGALFVVFGGLDEGSSPDGDAAVATAPAARSAVATGASKASAARLIGTPGTVAAEAAGPQPAAVKLVSDPPGATVQTADGKELGKTPLSLTEKTVRAGSRLTITHKGYFQAKSAAIAYPKPGKEREVRMELSALPQVSLRSSPEGAQVTIPATEDPIGVTPFTWVLPAEEARRVSSGGVVMLSFGKPGYKPVKKVLANDLIKDGKATIAVTLKAYLSRAPSPTKARTHRSKSTGTSSSKSKPKPKPKKKSEWSF